MKHDALLHVDGKKCQLRNYLVVLNYKSGRILGPNLLGLDLQFQSWELCGQDSVFSM